MTRITHARIAGATFLIYIAAGLTMMVGSALFCSVFLRARSIPVSLAWLGLLASALLVVVLPLQLAGFLQGPLTSYAWIPMLVQE